jgi:hypothetical protein
MSGGVTAHQPRWPHGHLWHLENVLYSFGTHCPLAWRVPDLTGGPTRFVVHKGGDKKVTVSTGKHLSTLLTALGTHCPDRYGYSPIIFPKVTPFGAERMYEAATLRAIRDYSLVHRATSEKTVERRKHDAARYERGAEILKTSLLQEIGQTFAKLV